MENPENSIGGLNLARPLLAIAIFGVGGRLWFRHTRTESSASRLVSWGYACPRELRNREPETRRQRTSTTRWASQDFNVISLLADIGNGEVQTPTTDLPKVKGEEDAVSTSGRILHWDTEWHWDATYTQYPHQAFGGQIVALGLTNAYQIWNESTAPIFNWARQQGGMAGFAHFQFLDDNFPTLSVLLHAD